DRAPDQADTNDSHGRKRFHSDFQSIPNRETWISHHGATEHAEVFLEIQVKSPIVTEPGFK
ncbi:MAG: hypothetical protein ABSA26_07620, partial [Thermoguttaceae bacterium]